MSSIRARFVIKFASWFGCSWSSLPSSFKEFAWKINPNLWFEMPTKVLTLIFLTGFKFTTFVKASRSIVSLLLSICCCVFDLGLMLPEWERSPSWVRWPPSSSSPCWQARWYKLKCQKWKVLIIRTLDTYESFLQPSSEPVQNEYDVNKMYNISR